MSLSSLREVSGSARIALLSWSYKTMIYLLPREEVTRKRPVWSVLTFPVNYIVCRYAIWFWTLSSCEGRGGVVITCVLEMVVAGGMFLVDRTFCRSWRRFPFAVAMLLGKCFRTRVDVRPGHVAKKPAVIAVVHDDTTGMKAALWRYCMMSDLVERVWKLFKHGEC